MAAVALPYLEEGNISNHFLSSSSFYILSSSFFKMFIEPLVVREAWYRLSIQGWAFNRHWFLAFDQLWVSKEIATCTEKIPVSGIWQSIFININIQKGDMQHSHLKRQQWYVVFWNLWAPQSQGFSQVYSASHAFPDVDQSSYSTEMMHSSTGAHILSGRSELYHEGFCCWVMPVKSFFLCWLDGPSGPVKASQSVLSWIFYIPINCFVSLAMTSYLLVLLEMKGSGSSLYYFIVLPNQITSREAASTWHWYFNLITHVFHGKHNKLM